MTFTTVTFLAFLLVVYAAYWALPGRRSQNLLLVVASYVFYGWWDWRFCALMLATCLIDFGATLGIARFSTPSRRRLLLVTSLASNLVVLGIFKYFNFFAASLAAGLAALGWSVTPPYLEVILPAGISFYTFQALGYVIDVYRRETRAVGSLLDYMAFISFFPQLVAGPIERAPHLLPQFVAPRTFDYAESVDGCRQILWGLCKKLALADNLASVVDLVYGQPSASGGQLALGTVCFAFQIYCDFSAYSDIAAGAAKLFGIRLMRNFAYPYFAQSLGEFWRRWHISLSSWFRDYLFIPLGGNRVTRARHAVNLLAVFVVSGLWHGANWTFVVWGAVHGCAVVASLLAGPGPRPQPRAPVTAPPGGELPWPTLTTAWSILRTFAVVCLAWVFFRAPSLGEAASILRRMLHIVYVDREARATAMLVAGLRPQARLALLLLPGLVGAEWLQRHRAHPLQQLGGPRWVRWALYTVLGWLAVGMAPTRANRFIYFQF
jgi:D-alanyl-lipoteichoic acid acyltransferase DltB (MBOAT superfamily)